MRKFVIFILGNIYTTTTTTTTTTTISGKNKPDSTNVRLYDEMIVSYKDFPKQAQIGH